MMLFVQRLVLVLIAVVLVALRASAAQVITSSTGSILFDPDLTAQNPFTGKFCRSISGDGGLIVTNVSTDKECNFLLEQDRTFSGSYRIEAVARLRQGPQNKHYGIIIGSRPDTTVTLTITNSGEVALEWWQDSKWHRVAPVKPAPVPRTVPGATNRLTIEVKGTEVSGFLNDQLVATGRPGIALDGNAGAYLDAPGQEAVFTEFKITSLTAPTTAATTPPAVQTGPTTPAVPPPAKPTPTIPTPPWATMPTTPSTLGGPLGGSTALPGGGDFKPTAGGVVFLDDDLATTQRLPVESDAACTTSYGEGGFTVTAGANGCEWEAQYLAESAMRARFEVSLRILKGDAAGFDFGRTRRDDNLHYHFKLSGDGQFILDSSQNRETTPLIPWTKSSAIRTGIGATNRIAVEVLGQEVRLFVNGQYIGRATSPHVVQGGYGFHVVSGNGRVVFNNLKVTDFNASTTTAREAAGSRALASGASPPTRNRAEATASETTGTRKR